ncbi:glycerol-3-phosphate acyltransferase 3-like [Tubulanus polymorphus]|uniref:glycerol-3-phosphate acyltransferase 3-like n=1 Tax=Tubulanus polymorphus TaxID=672921 RepID=UPI003DA5E3BC
MSMEQTFIWVISALFSPFLITLFSTVILASCGKSLGIRKLYVNTLLKVFEWGHQRVKDHEQLKRDFEDDGEDENKDKDDPQLATGDSNDVNNVQPQVIKKELPISASKPIEIPNERSLELMDKEFHLSDVMYFCKSGIEAIIEDDVTQRFNAEELTSWNLLTRTNRNNEFVSLRLTILWWIGCLVRYLILLPFRIGLACIGITWLLIGTACIGYLKNGRMKRRLNEYVNLTAFRIMARAFSAVITFHNRENKAKGGGIGVANHTSPIDVVFLSTDNCYAMVGQAQGGFLGMMQRALSRAEAQVWFERSEVRDRVAVANRLRNHVEDKNKLPILIFPEGTCINNTSVMMFKKGSFEVGGTVYPAAIKYDARFADAFWNSSKESMVQHILMILTSWAIVCDVWYLPPCTKGEDESAIEFAYRVKQEIAKQGGLVDLEWDGQLKRSKPKESFKQLQQKEYSKLLTSKTEELKSNGKTEETQREKLE